MLMEFVNKIHPLLKYIRKVSDINIFVIKILISNSHSITTDEQARILTRV